MLDIGTREAGPTSSRLPSRRRLRVGMVVYSDYHLDARVQREACALAERGDDVEVVCLSASEEIRVGRGRVRLHGVLRRKLQGAPSSYIRGYSRFVAGALIKLRAIDRSAAVDVVHVHNMPNFLTLAALPQKLRGVPLVLDQHDTFPELFATKYGLQSGHLLMRAALREERWSAAVADGVLVVTEEARERLNGRGVGGPATRVVMNSPDERIFGTQRPAVHPPAEGPVRCVYHGGLAPRFGVDSLLRAVGALERDLPRLTLDVYGPGDERETLRRDAQLLAPARITVAREPTPLREIPARLSLAHIGVVPTLRDRFTELLLPVKLLEYVHMGLPVVCSRLPVIEHYFSDDDVRFYEPGSPADLAAALRDVCSDPDAAVARARRAGAKLLDLGWSEQRRRYLSFVDELVARSSRFTKSPMVERSVRRAAVG
jgi:glycosyltransferase involved in cell wall biosynthesis